MSVTEFVGEGDPGHKQATQPAFHRAFQQAWPQHRLDRARCLPQAPHAFHSIKKRSGKMWIAEEMVVQEVEMYEDESAVS